MVAAASGMLPGLLASASSSCEEQDKLHADAAASAMLPMLHALSSLSQHYSCTSCLVLLLVILLVHVAGCALLLTCTFKQLNAV